MPKKKDATSQSEKTFPLPFTIERVSRFKSSDARKNLQDGKWLLCSVNSLFCGLSKVSRNESQQSLPSFASSRPIFVPPTAWNTHLPALPQQSL